MQDAFSYRWRQTDEIRRLPEAVDNTAVILKKTELHDPLVRHYLPIRIFPICLCVFVGFEISKESCYVLTSTSSLYLLLKMAARATCRSCGWPGLPVDLHRVLSMFSLLNCLCSFNVFAWWAVPQQCGCYTLPIHPTPETPLNVSKWCIWTPRQ